MLNPELYANALKNPDEEIRCEALNALLAKGGPAGLDLFLQAVEDASPRVRAIAVTGLGRFGHPRAVPVLLDALRDPVGKVRAEAAYAIAQFRDERSIDGILAVLERGDPMERAVAFMGLAFFPHERFAEPLQAALAEGESDVRNAAQAALNRHEEFYRLRLMAPYEPPAREEGLNWVAYEKLFQDVLDNPNAMGVDRLLRILTQETDAGERARMVRALACIDDPRILIPLIQCSEDADAEVRRASVGELGHLDDPLAQEVVERALDDSSEQVRIEALFAYARKKPSGLAHRMVRMLQLETSEKVREAVLYKLAKHDFARAEFFLRGDLESPRKDVCLKAAVLLAEQGDAKARTVLWNYLDDEDEWARALAVHGLGKLGDNSALSRLVEALQDDDADVRAAAAESLGNLGDPYALEPLRAARYDAYPAVREMVAESLARLENLHRSIAV
jgi:HEAT repeat protein